MSSTDRPSFKSFGRPHSNFQSRTATDDAGELNRRWSVLPEESPSPAERARPSDSREAPNPYEPLTNDSTPPPREHPFAKRLLHLSSNDGSNHAQTVRKRSTSGRRRGNPEQDPLTIQMNNEAEIKRANGDPSVPKTGLGPRPVGGSQKLGMFNGVYVPTCLNVMSILMFLRFGFILGQGGVLGIMGMFP